MDVKLIETQKLDATEHLVDCSIDRELLPEVRRVQVPKKAVEVDAFLGRRVDAGEVAVQQPCLPATDRAPQVDAALVLSRQQFDGCVLTGIEMERRIESVSIGGWPHATDSTFVECAVVDRRSVIADAAIDIVADAGLRALTHRAIDVMLELPSGSTSYYFRTKSALLAAMVDRITDCSRALFVEISDENDPVEISIRYLETLLRERRRQVRTRHILLLDAGVDAELRIKLRSCLFSVERATDLLGDNTLAVGYVALCEGLVVTGLLDGPVHGDALRGPIVTYLRGAGKS